MNSPVYKAKIIQCSGPEYWYAGLEGEEFEVYGLIDGIGYPLKEDYDNIKTVDDRYRLIIQGDAIIEKRLKDMECPQCHQIFQLNWEDWDERPRTLCIRMCHSGGIYNVVIDCPHCDYEEEL